MNVCLLAMALIYEAVSPAWPFLDSDKDRCHVASNSFNRTGGTMPFPKVGEVRAVTFGPKDHLLASYFAINSWSDDGRYLLVLETGLNGRLPKAGERCTIGVVDLEDGNRFIPVSTTACWNFQEAAMGHWLDNDTILFNDLRDGGFKAVVMDWRTGKDIRVLPMPVSAVSEDRTWAVSINYARLYLARPDYGYAGGGQNARETVEWPEDDGLWVMDLRTGDAKLVLSVAQGRTLMAIPEAEKDKPGNPLSYYCHTAISKDGAKIFFLARAVSWFDESKNLSSKHKTTSFTVNRDGTDLRRCFPDGWGGSHFNWSPDGSHKMLVTTTIPGNAWPSLVEFDVGRENEVRRIGSGILDQDWHCVYSPNGKFMSGEAYPNGNEDRCWILLRIEDELVKPLGAFHVPSAYRQNYWRCDLHARWRKDGKQLAFNSVHEGSRQVYVRDVIWADERVPRACRPSGYDGDRWKDYRRRFEEEIATAKAGGAPVVFIGDSITHNWENEGREVWARYFAAGRNRAVNFGIKGDSTCNLLYRLQNGLLDGFTARAVILQIGTNNLRYDSPDDIRRGVEACLDLVRIKQPSALIVLCPIPLCGRKPQDATRRQVLAANAEIALLAGKQNVRWCDWSHKMLRTDGIIPEDVAPDTCHPNRFGYECWAEAVLPILEEPRERAVNK